MLLLPRGPHRLGKVVPGMSGESSCLSSRRYPFPRCRADPSNSLLITTSNLTLQHLSTPSHTSHSLASTSLPSHTSATKFLTNRLYSKKRQLAVLDAGKPRTSEESGRKRKKKGGMSAESRALLGMGIDDGAKEKEDAAEKERNRKRSLLLQAEGKRKPGEFESFVEGVPECDR